MNKIPNASIDHLHVLLLAPTIIDTECNRKRQFRIDFEIKPVPRPGTSVLLYSVRTFEILCDALDTDAVRAALTDAGVKLTIDRGEWEEIEVPTMRLRKCAVCAGTGGTLHFACESCAGTGRVSA